MPEEQLGGKKEVEHWAHWAGLHCCMLDVDHKPEEEKRMRIIIMGNQC